MFRANAPASSCDIKFFRRSSPRLILEIDIGKLLAVAGPIADIALYLITSSALASS
jgi:hypothetical protein